MTNDEKVAVAAEMEPHYFYMRKKGAGVVTAAYAVENVSAYEPCVLRVGFAFCRTAGEKKDAYDREKGHLIARRRLAHGDGCRLGYNSVPLSHDTLPYDLLRAFLTMPAWEKKNCTRWAETWTALRKDVMRRLRDRLDVTLLAALARSVARAEEKRNRDTKQIRPGRTVGPVPPVCG